MHCYTKNQLAEFAAQLNISVPPYSTPPSGTQTLKPNEELIAQAIKDIPIVFRDLEDTNYGRDSYVPAGCQAEDFVVSVTTVGLKLTELGHDHGIARFALFESIRRGLLAAELGVIQVPIGSDLATPNKRDEESLPVSSPADNNDPTSSISESINAADFVSESVKLYVVYSSESPGAPVRCYPAGFEAHVDTAWQESGKYLVVWPTDELWNLSDVTGPDVTHSLDFRAVKWFGEHYTFTANQAQVVGKLYTAWKSGALDVGDDTLLRAVDDVAPPRRLNTLFRKHPAWKTMIVRGGTKGAHRLAEPPQETS